MISVPEGPLPPPRFDWNLLSWGRYRRWWDKFRGKIRKKEEMRVWKTFLEHNPTCFS